MTPPLKVITVRQPWAIARRGMTGDDDLIYLAGQAIAITTRGYKGGRRARSARCLTCGRTIHLAATRSIEDIVLAARAHHLEAHPRPRPRPWHRRAATWLHDLLVELWAAVWPGPRP